MAFLDDFGLVETPTAALADTRVAYHDACHALRAQGIKRQPRDVLRQIPGTEIVELANGDRCCGAAGLYNVLEPEMSGALMRQKAEAVRDAGVRVVASANPGCTMQIAAGLAGTRRGRRGRAPRRAPGPRVSRELRDGSAACWYRRAMTYVGVGRRFVAIFVDSILLLILSGPFAEIRHGDGYLQIDWHGRRLFWPSLIVICYFVLLEGIAGATIGKFLTGIRVVNQDGTKLDWSAAFVRNIARIVDAFPYAFPYLVGAISVWASPIQQRLGDRWANTVVVTKESVRESSVPGPGNHRGRRMAARADATSGERSYRDATAPPAAADAAADRLTTATTACRWLPGLRSPCTLRRPRGSACPHPRPASRRSTSPARSATTRPMCLPMRTR